MVSNYHSSIDTVDYLNCGDGDSIWTSMNELPLLVGERAVTGGKQQRKGEGCALHRFVGDVDGRGIGWNGAVSLLHLGDEGEKKIPAIM